MIKRRTEHSIRRIVTICLFFGLVSCANYRMIDIDVLKPANKDFNQKDVNILLMDRKLVHKSDVAAENDLYRSLFLKRENLIECFYNGIQDGFENSPKKVKIGRAIGNKRTEIDDTILPVPLTSSELDTINKGFYSYILAVEDALFRWYDSYHGSTQNGLFVRLYDTDTKLPVDSMESDILKSHLNMVSTPDDICDFYYQQGVNYAKHVVPYWSPEKRRIFMNNNTLKLGYYFLKSEDYDQAYKIWNAALNMRPGTAVKAAINLAWLSERKGNFQGAINMLEAALSHMKKHRMKNYELSEYIKNYIRILNGRQEDDKKLSNQL